MDWMQPKTRRMSSPRAKPAVRARVVHTDGPRRKLDVFVTEPVQAQLGWKLGQMVEVHFSATSGAMILRMRPAHRGLTLRKDAKTTRTARVTISGAPLAPTMCAKVREVPYSFSDGVLFAHLPAEWFA